jgi:signal transduction histidine kinase
MALMLDTINVLLIITALVNLSLGALIYFHGRNKRNNIIYSLNIVGITSWVLAMIIFRSSPPEYDLFWCTLLYITPTFIASSLLYLSYIFPTQQADYKHWKTFLIFFINALLIVAIAYPGFMITDVIVRGVGMEKEIVFTQAYWFYFLYTAGFFTYGFIRLYNKYRKSVGLERVQTLYLYIGYSLAANLAFATNLIMPWIGYFFLNWLGQMFTFFIVGFTAYAIVRYRFMDIRIVARKTFIYGLLAVYTFVVFYLIVALYIYFFGSVHTFGARLISPFVALVFVLSLFKLNELLRQFANKHLFASLYSYQETITGLTKDLNNHIDLNKISGLIVNTTKKTLQLDRAALILVDQTTNPIQLQVAKNSGFNSKEGLNMLLEDDFIATYLKKSQKTFVREEVDILIEHTKNKKDKESLMVLSEKMREMDAALASPIVSGKKLIGIVVLSPKISKDPYSREDLQLLDTMAKQAGTALENALHYKQIKEFTKTLQAKVDEQTKYLQELLEMKGDFLRVVNHQLNTPLSVMKGYFGMMEDSGYPVKKALPAIKASLDRISTTVADFWGAYELEGERMKMNPQKTDLADIVDKLIIEKKRMKMARERKLSIVVKKPKTSVPLVWCDYKKISHAISNLVENAVHYTREGGLTITYVVDPSFVKFSVTDTGVGLAPGDEEKLFKKFSRGGRASDLRPDGSGLGLFITKKIVEGNMGEIEVTSPGKNQGSTFSFTVPIYKDQKVEKKQREVSRKKIVIFKK